MISSPAPYRQLSGSATNKGDGPLDADILANLQRMYDRSTLAKKNTRPGAYIGRPVGC